MPSSTPHEASVRHLRVPADAIGPQQGAEATRAKRLRLHQAWYRTAILRLPRWGWTAKGKPLGSILHPDDALLRLNLNSIEAQNLFERRRSNGWGIDSVRVLGHMISSQALAINFFGPILANPTWLLDFLSSLFGRDDFVEIEDARLEYAPARRSAFMNDMTMVDLFVQVLAGDESVGIVIELKYADRLNSRLVPIAENVRYRAMLDEGVIWKDESALTNARFNQLVRCHALAQVVVRMSAERHQPEVLFALIADVDDSKAFDVLNDYKQVLVRPSLASAHSLATALEIAFATAPSPASRNLMEEMTRRYVALSESDYLIS